MSRERSGIRSQERKFEVVELRRRQAKSRRRLMAETYARGIFKAPASPSSDNKEKSNGNSH
jgi:hypothetical protein